MAQDKNSLITEGKRKKNSDTKAITHHVPQAERCPASLQATAILERHPPRFYCWAWCYMSQNIALTSLGQLAQLCLLQASCPTPTYSLRGQSGKYRKPWCHDSPFQQQIKHGVLATQLQIQNTAPYRLLWRKLSVPARPSTKSLL